MSGRFVINSPMFAGALNNSKHSVGFLSRLNLILTIATGYYCTIILFLLFKTPSISLLRRLIFKRSRGSRAERNTHRRVAMTVFRWEFFFFSFSFLFLLTLFKRLKCFYIPYFFVLSFFFFVRIDTAVWTLKQSTP